ncbi:hypothetical protein CACET_c03130 [Clostridium aceticum]|uniref:Uncharacterized protein n=1 Tax=Clostridium aceticum TaxID=84022 RepID=A0A0D8I9G5_9CLOT|nr:DUF6240 domain-containing protein [Clostridium aceticum]AKL93829.1 hypothetical protein CACET_c03130 [Clostridium aceticum]KJF25856.1 hypothetical protein TZ02_16840 [Clostridium aceticum]
MNSSIFQKLTMGIRQQQYGKGNESFKIKGTLVSREENRITLHLGDQKMLEVQLKGGIEGNIGDTVVVDKKDFIKSKLYDESDTKVLEEVSEEKAEVELLKKLDVPITEVTKNALTALEKHGLKISKENLQAFVSAKEHLEQVVEGLDYDTAIKLLKKDVDISEEALQNLAMGIQEVKGEKEGFSLLKLFKRKKELSTEDAEKISMRLYGNKMGKDVIDVMRALHKAEMDITKKNIHRIHDVIRKVDDLQNIKEETIIDAVKNKIDATVDYLYKLKNAVVKGNVQPQKPVTKAVTNLYEATSYRNSRVSEKDLRTMEEDIKELLAREEVKVTEEIVRLSKDFVKAGVDLTKTNIEKVQQIKEAIQELKAHLNYDKTAELLSKGIEVEKAEITELLRQMKISEKEPLTKNLLSKLEKLEQIENEKLIELIKEEKSINIKTLMELVDKRGEVPEISKSSEDLGVSRISTSEARVVMDTSLRLAKLLNHLKDLSFDTVAFQMNNKLPMTLKTLSTSQELLAVREEVQKLSEEDSLHGKEVEKLQEKSQGLTKNLQQYMKEAVKLPKIAVGSTIDTIRNFIEKSGEKFGLTVETRNIEAVQALLKNSIPLNRENIAKLYETNLHVENITENLTTAVVDRSLQEGLKLEELEVKDLAEYAEKQAIKENLPEKAVQQVETEAAKEISEIAQEAMREGSIESDKELQDIKAKGVELEEMISEKAFDAGEEAIVKPEIKTFSLGLQRLEMLEKLEKIETSTLVFQMKNQLPITIEALELSQKLLQGEQVSTEMLEGIQLQFPEELSLGTDIIIKNYLKENASQLGSVAEDKNIKEIIRSLLANNLSLNKSNLQSVHQLQKHLTTIKEGMTTDLLEKIEQKEMALEKTPIKVLRDFVEQETSPKLLQEGGIFKGEALKGLLQSMENITYQQKDSILSLLLKNAMPITLKEVQNLSFFLGNQQQIGSQMKEILEMTEKSSRREIKEIAHKMRELLQGVDETLKVGKVEGNRPYEEFGRLLKQLETKAYLLDEETKISLQKTGGKLLDSLEIQMNLNKEDTVLQLPVMMGDQLKNLQIYVMKDKKGSKKIDPRDMSILLNFDTNTMGNVNVYVGVNYKRVVMKMGLNRQEDQQLVTKHENQLKELLQEMGYELKDLSFRVEEQQHILTMADEINATEKRKKNLLDVKI